MAQANGHLDVCLALIEPAGADSGFSQSSLWQLAKAIPSATVLCDAGGIESRRFRMQTSGEAVLYDPGGRLAYHGGITAARGHEGDNPGRDQILAILADKPGVRRGPAFGCPLEGTANTVRQGLP